jgi:hypothetical protein
LQRRPPCWLLLLLLLGRFLLNLLWLLLLLLLGRRGPALGSCRSSSCGASCTRC